MGNPPVNEVVRLCLRKPGHKKHLITSGVYTQHPIHIGSYHWLVNDGEDFKKVNIAYPGYIIKSWEE